MSQDSTPKIDLLEADAAEVLIIIDNYVDVLLPHGPQVERPALAKNGQIPSSTLLAEHGLSLLITMERQGRSHQVLLDAGYTQVGVPHNLDMLGISLTGLEAIVLSHGHMDHFGSLPEVVRRVGRPVTLVAHPDALEGQRFRKTPFGDLVAFPKLSAEQLSAAGAEIVLPQEPYLAASKMWAATGQVPRTTDFEQGMPGAMKDYGQGPVPDPMADDMAIVLNLKDKGLAVISGCAHAGIVNTVRHAVQMTGVDRVYAVIGGFHLGGPAMEPIIDATVRELKAYDPQIVMPMHCTGRNAQAEIERAMGPAYVVSSVGSRVILA